MGREQNHFDGVLAVTDDLKVKRVYEPPSPEDGARVLVDRVWPRGVKKEGAQLRLWLREAAPSTGLRRWYGHDPARFEEFRRRYRAELEANPGPVGRLLDLLRAGRLTLLYGARDETHNQARVLAEYLDEERGAHGRRSA
jgi:uncharacterized protein YeaO (DUF488 family)